MARINEREDWFELWFDDRQSIVETMVRNMTADLNAGYSYFGNCITKQKQDIEAYKQETDNCMDMFKGMDEKQVSRWCYYDLKKRGAIA